MVPVAGYQIRPLEGETHMSAVRVPVLMYHRVGEARDAWERKYCIRPENFAAHMAALSKAGWQAVTVDDFMSWLKGTAQLPDKSFVLSFDDGFKGVHDHAWPVLQKHGWPAVMFLVSHLLGDTDAWSRTENPSGRTYPLLSIDEIKSMAISGFSFHAHSRCHRDLTTLTESELADETSGCKTELESLGLTISYYAYPYGRFEEREARAVAAAGFTAAFSVQPGFNRLGVDPYRIRRLDIFGTDSPAMLLRKITLGSNDGRLTAWARYYVKQLGSRAGL